MRFGSLSFMRERDRFLRFRVGEQCILPSICTAMHRLSAAQKGDCVTVALMGKCHLHDSHEPSNAKVLALYGMMKSSYALAKGIESRLL